MIARKFLPRNCTLILFITCVKPVFSDLGMVKIPDLPSPGIVSGLLHTETLDTHPDEAPRYPVKEPGTLLRNRKVEQGPLTRETEPEVILIHGVLGSLISITLFLLALLFLALLCKGSS